MLKISNVETFYGKIQALRGVNIDINKGEIVSLIGSNGAGKSTLLMTISGVNKAKTGEIIFEGNYRFDVFGKLTAIGDSTNYIKFTGNGSQWMSINFADASDDNSTLEYCIIENASESGYEPYYGAINFNQSSPTIKNSVIQNCSSQGIYLYYSNALIEKNLIPFK